MPGELINGVYRVLGELPDAPRPDLYLGHSLVTGELVVLALNRAKDAARADQMRREGEVFGGVASPHVHALLDWDTEQGFLAWEYVPGWPLWSVLRPGRPSDLGWVLSLMRDVAAGLGAVHSHGAIYRALHPGQILINRDGGSRLMTTPHSVVTNRTRMVEIGPPEETPIYYLSPEQIEGSIDARADIYSLAAVGYEALTGQTAYANGDPVTLAVQILKTAPRPPSDLRPDVPADVDDFFAHCLARDPDARPSGAMAMLVHLNKLIDRVAADAETPRLETLRRQPVIFPLMADDADDAELVVMLARTQSRPDAAGDEDDEDGLTSEDEGKDTWEPEPAPALEPALALAGHEVTTKAAWRLVAPSGEVFPLLDDLVLVGRADPGSELPALDLGDLDAQRVISRHHARLERHNGSWRCVDLGARNGTWVNGRRLGEGESAIVDAGDTVRFAHLELKLEPVRSG